MPRITLAEISALQNETSNIRNVCFLAHIDHGKTTLCDHLIATNGIISPKLAGSLRYLDSRPDEQEKLITMKASSISLVFYHKKTKLPYLINLLDSPGHVDFSNETSTALKLSDGALVVVDVLEGICVQTISVLQQAWKECVLPCIVFNKMDRLILELNMTPMEAYLHIQKLLERINAIVATFTNKDALRKDEETAQKTAQSATASESIDTSEKQKKKKDEDKDKDKHKDTDEYLSNLDDSSQWKVFSPELGNVVFCSAIHKWGFTIESMASFYHKKMKMNKKALRKVLWGNYYFDKKSKQVSKKPFKTDKYGNSKSTPIFVKFAFEPIWELYNNMNDCTKLTKMIKKLDINIPTRELNMYTKTRQNTSGDNNNNSQVVNNATNNLLVSIMSRWLPISNAILNMSVSYMPSPVIAQRNKMDKIWDLSLFPNEMKEAIFNCDNKYENVLMYVPKMVCLSKREIEDALEAGMDRTHGPRFTSAKDRSGGKIAYEKGKFKVHVFFVCVTFV